ncbi:hypothetical protein [Deinococcus cellulosilyticus]|uniref:Uncharacterized protein n=1 Tax=Deinococcus cellulosilyticus (strain DSM 18568 / NBRC 106333 / KACC 11606 / 5516J-15) TaxID=1223518 RepID=A0A511N0E8_DEIC1|nr:hypothetical protein [Deinococcus cellulosilyticus]GEM45897.1 hypothetical protein DC3_15320 [Deinococcus cellulosilyticus NBRC 106333 = KACC 11606]
MTMTTNDPTPAATFTQFDHKRFWKDAVQGFAEWYYDPKWVTLGDGNYTPISFPKLDSTRPPNPHPLTGSITVMGMMQPRIAIVDVAGFKITITPDSLSAAENTLMRSGHSQKPPISYWERLKEFKARKPARGERCPDLWESRYKKQREAIEELLKLVLNS